MAKRNTASLTICSTAFLTLGRAQAKTLGMPDLPIAVIQHPFGVRTRDEIRALAAECVGTISSLVTEPQATESGSADAAEESPGDVRIRDDLGEINRLFRERQWSDGLPIVPPTAARVESMLAGLRLPPTHVVARLAPGFGVATVERIAVNAVLAGCDPQAMPVLLAAVEAITAEEFNLQGIQTTTNPVAIFLLINGPVAKQLDINGKFNCLGDGSWANLTIGRALRLVLRNVGGALPGDMDRATQGQPAKLALCCAENEEDSPWPPLHLERGFAKGQSTVTAISVEGTMNMNTHTKNALDLARVTAETMIHPPSNEYCNGGEPLMIFGPEHAQIFHKAGMNKDDVRKLLWKFSMMPASRMSDREMLRVSGQRREELGEISANTLLPISRRPEDILIAVCGGPGTHSIYVPGFGNSRAVTREIKAD